jgi:HK97 gp10 family phage protein
VAEEFKIKGLAETVKALEVLPDKLVKKALRKALQAGGEVLGNAVMERTPVDTGLLRESVGLAVTVHNDASGEANVGFGRQDYVARFVEFGHRIVGHKPNKKDTGKHVPARPFIRPAFDASKDKAVETFADVIEEQVQTLGGK